MNKPVVLFAIFLFTSLSFSQPKSFVVTGSLLGSDGRPIQVAHVNLLSNAPRTPRFLLQSTRVAQDGSFELSYKTPGLYRLQFTGVDHSALEIPFLLQEHDPVVLTVQLKAYEYPDSLGRIRLIGDFNNFSINNSALAMVKRDDGTYVTKVKVNADTLAYQIWGAEKTGNSINGTQSDYFVYDGGGDYRSVIRTKGDSATIIFDPTKLKRFRSEPVVRFQNEKSLAARFYQLHVNLENRKKQYVDASNAYKASGKSLSDFSYDRSQDLADIKNLMHHETDTTLKQAWLIGAIENGAMRKDSTITSVTLNSISPSSSLWSYSPGTLQFCVSKSDDKEKGVLYLQKAIDEQLDMSIKPFLIGELLFLAKASGNDSLVAHYYQILETEFKDSPWAQMAETKYSPNRAIKVGNTVPDFSVKSLEDTNVVFTNTKFLGTVYLIDFWATWCVPCVAEMKNLHEAYDRFKSKGLTILSVSFDYKSEDISKFREGTWPMPWLHTYTKSGFESELAKTFEISGIPKPVLVGKDGKILATEDDLRGEKLLSTLSKIFEK